MSRVTNLVFSVDADGRGYMWSIRKNDETVAQGHSNGTDDALRQALTWANDNQDDIL